MGGGGVCFSAGEGLMRVSSYAYEDYAFRNAGITRSERFELVH